MDGDSYSYRRRVSDTLLRRGHDPWLGACTGPGVLASMRSAHAMTSLRDNLSDARPAIEPDSTALRGWPRRPDRVDPLPSSHGPLA